MLDARQYTKLGLFIITATALMLLSIVLVGGRTFFRETETYWVISEETVAGIKVESPVTMRGVEIGEVVAIKLDRRDFGAVRVEFEIDPSVQVPAGSKAYFRRSGLTGERAIDLTGGTLTEGRLLPGSAIPRGKTTLEELESRADRITTELVTFTEQANAVARDVRAIVDEVEPRQVATVVDDTGDLLKSLDTASGQFEATMVEGRSGIRDIVRDVDDVAQSATVALEGADAATDDASTLLRHADIVLKVNEDDLRRTVGNVRRTSRDAKALVRALRAQPSLLLRSAPPPERDLP